MSSSMFFRDAESLVRILAVAPAAYVALLLFLRVSGKRTLTKLNAFDLVITVALGSMLATQILSADTSLAEGVLAFATLIGLQWLVSFTSVRSQTVRDLVRSEPRLLASDGALHHGALRHERLTPGEVLQAVRSHGGASIEDARAVYLQTDGSLAVILRGGSPG